MNQEYTVEKITKAKKKMVGNAMNIGIASLFMLSAKRGIIQEDLKELAFAFGVVLGTMNVTAITKGACKLIQSKEKTYARK